jgi:hypothetical protein
MITLFKLAESLHSVAMQVIDAQVMAPAMRATITPHHLQQQRQQEL